MVDKSEISAKLIGPGITIVGWIIPVVIALTLFGINPAISPQVANSITAAMWGMLVVVGAFAFHVVTCVLSIAGLDSEYIQPLYTFIVAFAISCFLIFGWILAFILGGLS